MKTTRAKSAKPKPRPVNEQFCSKVNQYKFSIPITLNTARNIETTFTKESIRKLLIKQEKKNKAPDLAGGKII